jgi:S1-C subfamily serine protease
VKSNQRIIKLAVALLLVLTTTFSLSSCLLLDFEIYQEILKDQFGNNEDNGQNNGDNNNENNNESNEEENTKVPEFYPGSQGSTENVPALQRSLLSTVMIFSDFNESSSGGSGVIYQIDKEKGDAYIITNQHVVFMDGKIADKITVYLYGMELETYAIKAAYVGGTTNYDIAVIKIEGSDILHQRSRKLISLLSISNIYRNCTEYIHPAFTRCAHRECVCINVCNINKSRIQKS